jgi:hypothetical protein
MTDGIFPITESEADVLHDMGWRSGYAWATEWDWWKSSTDTDQQMVSRDWDETKQNLYAALIVIRTARLAADDLVKKHMSAAASQDHEVTE